MRISLYIALLLFILSCQKRQHSVIVSHADAITHHSAEIHTYTTVLKHDNLFGGICWSTTPFPTRSDDFLEDQFLSNDSSSYELENLYANTTYYVRSFLEITSTEIIYSEQYQFNTSNLPPLPCQTTSNFVEIDNQPYTTLSMTEVFEEDRYALEADLDIGRFMFVFKEQPLPGQYYLNDDIDDLGFKEIYIEANLKFGTSCWYGITSIFNSDNQIIKCHVTTNQNGLISIAFCGVQMANTCFSNIHVEVTGQFNQ